MPRRAGGVRGRPGQRGSRDPPRRGSPSGHARTGVVWAGLRAPQARRGRERDPSARARTLIHAAVEHLSPGALPRLGPRRSLPDDGDGRRGAATARGRGASERVARSLRVARLAEGYRGPADSTRPWRRSSARWPSREAPRSEGTRPGRSTYSARSPPAATPRASDAEQYYRQTVSIATELRMRPLLARCHLGLGALENRAARRSQAREHLSLARVRIPGDEDGLLARQGQGRARLIGRAARPLRSEGRPRRRRSRISARCGRP